MKNEEVYGQAEVPEVNLQSFKDVPIGLFCGKTDLATSHGDYFWLRDELIKAKNCQYFKEYMLGHFGLLFPRDKTIFYDLLALTYEHLSDEDRQRINVPAEHA